MVLLASVGASQAAPLAVVAAENVYGDIARQIGGDGVQVESILSNPAQDPHLFEASPSVAAAVGKGDIIIANGLGYDPWMESLVQSAAKRDAVVLVAGDIGGLKAGANPHVWYDTAVAVALARALAEKLSQRDSAHVAAYGQNLQAFEASLLPLQQSIAQVAARHAATPVAATEPVFGPMLAAMKLDVKEQDFQRAVMNDTEPAISDVARFEQDLKSRAVKLLVFNAQAPTPLAQKMVELAKANGIPVVPVTETEPPGQSYQQWLLDEATAVSKALDGVAP
ncbi:MAG: zinc ABC transporter substrate-binding protein [Alphaproteobacteria bacterium]|nr:zinc ABC transporter substrate-binding protein [Alphaproteobacteria bacterium]